MHIANPIYDVVFKFMMEDNRVARAFLSAIIQEKVLELEKLKAIGRNTGVKGVWWMGL
jgi:hypothetical protein